MKQKKKNSCIFDKQEKKLHSPKKKNVIKEIPPNGESKEENGGLCLHLPGGKSPPFQIKIIIITIIIIIIIMIIYFKKKNSREEWPRAFSIHSADPMWRKKKREPR